MADDGIAADDFGGGYRGAENPQPNLTSGTTNDNNNHHRGGVLPSIVSSCFLVINRKISRADKRQRKRTTPAGKRPKY